MPMQKTTSLFNTRKYLNYLAQLRRVTSWPLPSGREEMDYKDGDHPGLHQSA